MDYMSSTIHPKEVIITDENRDQLFQEAEALGKEYVWALKEQIRRQND
jgi:hypothetical protein